MKLTDKAAVVAEIEKIREHIKRLRYAVDANCIVTVRNTCKCLESSIDLLVNSINTLEGKKVQEEPVSEDLEEAAKRYSDNEDPICTCGEFLLKSFKAGAEWHKQQMKKDAIIATIVSDLDPHGADYGNQKIICGWGELEAKRFKNGSKVKLIIIKED